MGGAEYALATRPAELEFREPGIAVRVRIVWEQDGEEYLNGVARRWDADHISVEILDEKRLHANCVWLKAHDVYRRSPEPSDATRRARRRGRADR